MNAYKKLILWYEIVMLLSLVHSVQHFILLFQTLILPVRHFFVSYLERFQNYMDACKSDLVNPLEFQENLSLYIINKLL